ncbi:iron-containing alcohol dehydrogenase [Thermincola ferriacetica]|uniref:Glycerol dehydrogenase n=2 Tax=Thermincola TaxID=278993 RepID=D5XBV8_THEPJ|nr:MULTISPECIES: glycerol dehydrogenase [Thermincola]ADG81506.1 iron-containing alcohol dehydrogenase [Thermincola potens JR]KNZ68967.1 iron-containing alcohol dehydrogenase [Thermincola ferriacetica]
MAQKIMISPGRYVQGEGAIRQIGEQVKSLGKFALVIGDKIALPLTREDVQKSLQDNGINFKFEEFGGECSMQEINRLKAIGEEVKADVIIGIGGGKTLDTAKAVAYYMNLPVVIVPTIASTDAPCSALSVIYTPEGIFESYLILPANPNLVLVDTGIVAKAPVRLLVAGMGDALATWFEADACAKAAAKNMPGGAATQSALALARLCYQLLIDYGYRAKLAVEKGVATEDVEKVVEANTLLSGLGFESGGLAAAHAVHNGLTALEETHHYFHGEKVAFGTLVQMIMENRSNEELHEVLEFCVSVGLPVTLRQIGVTEVTPEKIRKVAEMSCAEGETIYNMPFPVTPDLVYNAILAADAIGEAFLAE